MRAGALWHRITLQTPTEVSDGKGGFVPGVPAVVYHRIPAFVEALAGRKLIRAQQVDPRNAYQVEMRYRTGVTSRLQIVYHASDGDRLLEILSVVDQAEDHWKLACYCAEAVVDRS
jgi:SPP1 family predicted phage head-tail adaptor